MAESHKIICNKTEVKEGWYCACNDCEAKEALKKLIKKSKPVKISAEELEQLRKESEEEVKDFTRGITTDLPMYDEVTLERIDK